MKTGKKWVARRVSVGVSDPVTQEASGAVIATRPRSPDIEVKWKCVSVLLRRLDDSFS